MKISFRDIIDKHKGSPALVIAHGPSFNPYISKIKNLKDRGFFIFGCNEWYHIYEEAPHYWLLANNVQRIQTDFRKMNQYSGKTVVVYADSVDLTNRGWVAQNLECDYLPYDQRHFESNPCFSQTCCGHIIPGRLTIQEELQRYTGADKHYGSGDTVALHGISLSVLTGCNPIYIIGMDLDYRLGYAQNKGNLITKVTLGELSEYTDRIISDLTVIRDSALKRGTRIFNLNKNTKFGVLPTNELTL